MARAKRFSDNSCEVIMQVSLALDVATGQLDELPESEKLRDTIDQLSTIVARLDAIIKDEEF